MSSSSQLARLLWEVGEDLRPGLWTEEDRPYLNQRAADLQEMYAQLQEARDQGDSLKTAELHYAAKRLVKSIEEHALLRLGRIEVQDRKAFVREKLIPALAKTLVGLIPGL